MLMSVCYFFVEIIVFVLIYMEGLCVFVCMVFMEIYVK